VDRADDYGRNGDLPWASVFDPAANMQALTAIQHEGFRAASELVDRFVRIAAAGISPTEAATFTAPQTEAERAEIFGAVDIQPLIRSWFSMMGQFVPGVAGAGAATHNGHDATFDLADVVADGRVSLEAVSGERASAEVWLVNQGREDRGKIKLRCGDLQSDRGDVIESSAVTIDPQKVKMPARSSRGVDVTVDVGADVAPGLYRGTLLAQGFPDLWLPITVTVR
jgi:hypothetical protein